MTPAPTRAESARHPSTVRIAWIGEILAFAIAYAVAARPGWLVLDSGVTPLWPAAGLSVAWMYVRGRALWPGVAIGSILIDFAAGAQLWSGALAAAIANTAEALIAVTLLRARHDFDSAIRTSRDAGIFLLLGAGVAPAIGAVTGTTLLWLAGITPGHRYWSAMTQWWVGDAMGVLVVGTGLLVWRGHVSAVIRAIVASRSLRAARPASFASRGGLAVGSVVPRSKSWMSWCGSEIAVMAVGLGVAAALAFHSDHRDMPHSAREYLPIPFVIWAAMRHGVRGATAASALASLVGLWVVVSDGPASEPLFLFQTALAVIVVTALVVGAITDERRAHGRALRQSEAKFRSLYNSTPVMLHSIDARGRIVSVSDYWLATLGYTRDEVIGRRSVEFLTEESRRKAERQGLPALMSTGATRGTEYQFVRKDGSTVDVLLAETSERDAEGRFVRSLAVSLDITERKRAEAERKRMELQLQERQRLESLGLLAGGVAHDFNNLLTAILGNVDLARLDPRDDVRGCLDQIETAATRAAALCQQLLAYAGRGKVVLQTIDVNRLLGDTVGLVVVTIDKRISISADVVPALPAIVGDVSQVQQVVLNLLLNAAEAIGDGEGRIEVRAATVAAAPAGGSTEDRAPGEHVAIEISDTGSGMTDEVRARIFEPFFSTKFAGRGLGLAAVQGIVRGHGGAITVESTPGAGSTFRVFFPAVRVSQHGPEPARHADRARFTGTALVVDDDSNVRLVGRRCLEVLGFDVVSADSGEEALVRLDAGLAPRLVLLDLTMPGLSGRATFDAIRARRPEVPIVIMSGYTEHEVLQSFAQHGLSAFLQKPFNLEAVRGVVQRALDPSVGGLQAQEPGSDASEPIGRLL